MQGTHPVSVYRHHEFSYAIRISGQVRERSEGLCIPFKIEAVAHDQSACFVFYAAADHGAAQSSVCRKQSFRSFPNNSHICSTRCSLYILTPTGSNQRMSQEYRGYPMFPSRHLLSRRSEAADKNYYTRILSNYHLFLQFDTNGGAKWKCAIIRGILFTKYSVDSRLLCRTCGGNGMERNTTIIGQKLRKLREIKGLTQKDVGDLLHVSRTCYQSYETGEHEANRQTLLSLSQLYGVSLEALMDDEIDVNSAVRETQTYNRRKSDDGQILGISHMMTYEEYKKFVSFGKSLIRKKTKKKTEEETDSTEESKT